MTTIPGYNVTVKNTFLNVSISNVNDNDQYSKSAPAACYMHNKERIKQNIVNQTTENQQIEQEPKQTIASQAGQENIDHLNQSVEEAAISKESDATKDDFSDEATIQLKKLLGVSSDNPCSSVSTSNNKTSQQDPLDDCNFHIDLVYSGQDKRTTLMIKNIPNKYSQKMLLDSLEKHKGNFDFFYLPIDFKNKCNYGFAFINFVRPEYIPAFYQEFNGQTWQRFNSQKVCSISYAKIQGREALIEKNFHILAEDRKYRPLIFRSDGLKAGEEEEIPVDPNLAHRHTGPFFHGHRGSSTQSRGGTRTFDRSNNTTHINGSNPTVGMSECKIPASDNHPNRPHVTLSQVHQNHLPSHPPGWRRRK